MYPPPRSGYVSARVAFRVETAGGLIRGLLSSGASEVISLSRQISSDLRK